VLDFRKLQNVFVFLHSRQKGMLSTEYEIHESMGRSLIGGDLMGKKMER
jgi:hypothetical protein